MFTYPYPYPHQGQTLLPSRSNVGRMIMHPLFFILILSYQLYHCNAHLGLNLVIGLLAVNPRFLIEIQLCSNTLYVPAFANVQLHHFPFPQN
ncbi:hypothetical protein CFP56_023097 [Quercus suber]|uniref:Uncharacterized protein n=1 Tax=Quercus suber TaxID=58331 RepID=A0AAW0KAM7_QUESU